MKCAKNLRKNGQIFLMANSVGPMEICTLCESKMYEMKMQTSEDPTFWSRKYSVYISGTSGATTESFENIEIHTAHSIQKKKKN
ncbi:unnamed protein product [Tenebrio molitor]|nr:unnamed protein product [Tenebrio molitor]